jgi:protein-tyrosine phosphatase
MTPNEYQESPCYKVQSLVASEVTDELFIGSRKDACNKELLKKLGISAIVNATKDCPHHFEDDGEFSYFRVPVKDTWNQDLPSFFPECFKFIGNMIRARKKILIHCTAGISRSATLTIAYIMFSKRVTLNDAYKFVKSKRKAISPNLDFMGELQQYEKTLGLNRNSVMSMDISDDAEKSAPT